MPKKITSDYDSYTKDELLSETNDRKIIGITNASTKTELVSALVSDDKPAPQPPVVQPIHGQQPVFGQPVFGAKPVTVPANIPTITAENLPTVPGDVPRDEEYKDVFVHSGDGEPYALAIKKDAHDGRTHFCKNSIHFWNGTADEFKIQFDKK